MRKGINKKVPPAKLGGGRKNFRHLILLVFILIISISIIVFALPIMTIVSPTLDNNSYTNNNWVFVNVTSNEDLNQSLLEWGNSSGFSNVTMSNNSLTNWYKNMTDLVDYTYNYTIWAQNTTGNWNQSERYFVTVDTVFPQINFTNPTPDNGSTQAVDAIYVNLSTNDINDHYSFVDFDNSLVGWWRFEGNVNDESGYDYNDGIINGTISTYAGRFGRAYEFEGDDDYIEIITEFFSHATTYQHIPTYDGSNQTVHPDIYYNASSWNGWKYWMVITPYPNADSAYENPSILVSNNGSSWQVPSGLSNPIDPKPPSIGFNSDPDIINVNGNLWVYYRWNPGDGSTSLRMRNSTNGTSWSDEYEIFNVSTSGHFASPSLTYKDNLFKLWAVNTTGDSIIFYNSTDGLNWNGPFSTSISFESDPWHTNVRWIEEENEYWMIYCDQLYAGIYFLNSSDSINWQSWEKPLLTKRGTGWDKSMLYRSDFLYNSSNNLLELWYSANGGGSEWYTGYTNKSFSKNNLSSSLNFNSASDDISVFTWIKRKRSGNEMILDKRDDNDDGWVLRLVSDIIWFSVGGIDVKGSDTITDTNWHLVGVTIDRDGNGQVYIDGVADGSTVPISSTAMNIASSLYVGKASYVDSLYFNGTIDEITIFSRVLSSEEIIALYNSTKTYYNFTNQNEGTHTFIAHVVDEAGNKNSTETRTITVVDTTSPTISFSCSPTSVTTGQTITCSCSATDNFDSSPTVSYTASPLTSSTGTYTTTCTATDDAGNSATSSISYTVSGVDGGSAVSSSTSTTHSWSEIISETTTIMENFDEEIGIKQIQIEVYSGASDVRVSVTQYETNPVASESSGKVYKYLQIETENLEDKLNKSVITIQIEKNWTIENRIDRDNVAMFKFNESSKEWNELLTVYTEEDENYYYYDVELDSFSYFMIGEKTVIEKEEEEKGILERIKGVINNFIEIIKPYWLWILIGIGTIILIVGSIILLRRWKGKEEREEKKRGIGEYGR